MYQSTLCDNYKIPLNTLIEEIKQINQGRILIHAPNGLKHLYFCLEETLRSFNIQGIYFSSNPGYGACDIPVEEAEALRVNLIVHLGHGEYFSEKSLPRIGAKIVYIPVYYWRLVNEKVLRDLYDVLENLGVKSTTLSSTLVELYVKKQVSEYLTQVGIDVREVEKPILGCFYSHVISLENSVDAHVVIAGGVFHALGLGLIASKPVIALDPYMNKVWIASDEANRTLKKRFYTILKAKESLGSKVGLIVGTRPGQYRPALSSYIERLALTRGYKVYKITSSYLTVERLVAIDSALNLDIYVVTSCPRLPIDDLSDFHKPVLTPGEFIMLLTSNDKYIYPW